MSQQGATSNKSTTTKWKRRTTAVSTTATAALASPTAALLLIRGVSASNSTTSNNNATNYEDVIVSPTPLPAPIIHVNATIIATSAPTSKPTRLTIKQVGNNGIPARVYPLGTCLGDCDNDNECQEGLICFQRDAFEPVPGCNGGESSSSRMDVCIPPPVYTSSPTVSKSPSPQPTITASPTLSHAPSHQPSFEPTPSPTPDASEPVRLRLYWQANYYWQETRRETWWCMQCRDGPCAKNTIMEIDHCKKSNRQKFQYYETDKTFRPMTDPTLCFEENGWDFETNPIKLKPCNGSSKQTWTGFRGDKSPFEFKSGRNGNYCVTNPHHPREHERIFPQICRRARNHFTNKWVVY